MTSPPPKSPPPGLWQVIQSVLAAFFGVQTEAARQRDFTRGRPMHYIVIGLIATALFVLTIVLVVKLVLRQAGV
jgi:hypothetical protein